MAPSFSSCDYRKFPQSISFSGSGFLATYQLGVAQCFQNYAPWILRTAPCVLGASAGSLVAAAVVCEMNLITIRDEMSLCAKQMKAFTLGPFNPSVNVFHWLENILRKYLPSDAHQLASGRLAVAMTRLTDGKLIVVSEFQSKEDVVQALLCTCFVPGYCGFLPPTFKGVHYLDGGFSSMQPLLPLSSSGTLTVCPFSGEADICPVDAPCAWDMVVSGSSLKGNIANSFRIITALYPMAWEALEQAFHSGYKDAIHFLLSNDLAPYWIIHKMPQGPISNHKTDTWMPLETSKEEKEEMKVEAEAIIPTSFKGNRSLQMDNSTQQDPMASRPIKQPLFHFEVVKNVLLGNLESYLGMFGLPASILSYLLLPLMLLFYGVFQSKHRLKLFLRQMPQFISWTWHFLRQYNVFFFNIFVCSLQKYIEDRVVPVIVLLNWLKVQVKYSMRPHEDKGTKP